MVDISSFMTTAEVSIVCTFLLNKVKGPHKDLHVISTIQLNPIVHFYVNHYLFLFRPRGILEPIPDVTYAGIHPGKVHQSTDPNLNLTNYSFVCLQHFFFIPFNIFMPNFLINLNVP